MDSGELTVQSREEDQGRVEEGAVAREGKEGRARVNGEDWVSFLMGHAKVEHASLHAVGRPGLEPPSLLPPTLFPSFLPSHLVRMGLSTPWASSRSMSSWKSI